MVTQRIQGDSPAGSGPSQRHIVGGGSQVARFSGNGSFQTLIACDLHKLYVGRYQVLTSHSTILALPLYAAAFLVCERLLEVLDLVPPRHKRENELGDSDIISAKRLRSLR